MDRFEVEDWVSFPDCVGDEHVYYHESLAMIEGKITEVDKSRELIKVLCGLRYVFIKGKNNLGKVYVLQKYNIKYKVGDIPL